MKAIITTTIITSIVIMLKISQNNLNGNFINKAINLLP